MRGRCFPAIIPRLVAVNADFSFYPIPRIFMRIISSVLLFVALCGLAPASLADYVVRSQAMFADTIAEIYVSSAAVRVDLEIGAEDIGAFRELLPDNIYSDMGFGDEPFIQRLQSFHRESLRIDAEGVPLVATLRELKPSQRTRRDEISGEPLPDAGLEADTVLLASLIYTRPGGAAVGQPEALTFHPPRRYGTANIGFVAYHNGVAVNDFRYFSTSPRLLLDWEDPWYSAFARRSLRRTYYAPMSGFLYIEPFEVRKEVIVRPKDMMHWLDLGLEGLDSIPVELQADIANKVASFLGQHLPVEIDGRAVSMELDRVNYLRRTLRSSSVIDQPEALPLDVAVMGVIYSYPTDGLPERVTMEWDLFNERIQTIPAAATDQAGPLPQFLEPDYAVLEWQNFLKNPEIPSLRALQPAPGALAVAGLWLRWLLLVLAVLCLILAGYRGTRGRGPWVPVSAGLCCALLALGAHWYSRDARLISGDPAPIVDGLLRNIYHAFDFREREKIYDVLAQSVEGDLLTEIYLETLRGLELSNQGGARARVKSIELQELTSTGLHPRNGFEAEVTWRVTGSVGHWGHVHQRVNQYRANLTIVPQAAQWKLRDLDLLEEERL